MSNEQQIGMPDNRCPSCNSPQPHLHPAVQVEGEVSICVNAFHLIPTNQNDRAAIGRVLKAVEAGKLAACEDVMRGLAAYVGNGGYNSETVDPAVFEAKVRDGIDRLTAPLQTIIADLRADRVKLQDENDLLRHDLVQARQRLSDVTTAPTV